MGRLAVLAAMLLAWPSVAITVSEDESTIVIVGCLATVGGAPLGRAFDPLVQLRGELTGIEIDDLAEPDPILETAVGRIRLRCAS